MRSGILVSDPEASEDEGLYFSLVLLRCYLGLFFWMYNVCGRSIVPVFIVESVGLAYLDRDKVELLGYLANQSVAASAAHGMRRRCRWKVHGVDPVAGLVEEGAEEHPLAFGGARGFDGNKVADDLYYLSDALL